MNRFAWWGVWLGAAGLALAGAPQGPPVVSTQIFYYGMCDASAGVALEANLFAVANDEDNPIRIYHTKQGSLPLQTFDFSKFLGVRRKKPELDLEGACWLGERIFWITSHGRNHLGQYRPNRHRLFATEWKQTAQGFQLAPVGRAYGNLLLDLITEPRLRGLNLARAARLPPKEAGALNLEGLCPTPEGWLLIGFRNPIPGQQALIVPLVNPNEVISGKPARLGDPILLNLGGFGIRDLAFFQGQYVLLAGAYDATGQSALYLWAGGKAPPRKLEEIKLPDFNPEAIITYRERPHTIQLLSDDGTRATQGVPCKNLGNPAQQRFRSVWVTLPEN
jgi:hypothetical protein